MPAIPLGLSAYKRADLPPVTLKNYYFEKTPANLEDQVSLVPRPRIKQNALVGAGPMRGLYHKRGVILGRLLALSGNQLYRVEAAPAGTGTATLIGTVNGTGRMSAAGNASAVVVAAGAGAFTTDGVTMTAITVPDGQNVIAVDTLNSYILYFVENSGRYYWSAIGGTSIDPLDYATAESQPDSLSTGKVIGDVLWLVGRTSLEAWQPTGDLDLPFQRIQGRIFGIGCVARDTVQKLTVNGSETMCWVGADRKVYRLAPNPVPISDASIIERLEKADPATLYAEAFSWGDHDFYVLHIPGQGTHACDLSTGFWSELTSYGRSQFRGSVSVVGPNDQTLIGDDTSGIIWEFTEAERSDAGQPVVFEHTGLLENIGAPIRCKNVSLEVATGLTPDVLSDPLMELSISDDGGGEFWSAGTQPLGRMGMRAQKVVWPALGLIGASRIHRWRTIEPTKVRKAKYNEVFR